MNTVAADFTPTQMDVLYLLVIGEPRLSIARDLFLSARTVDQRIAGLKRALGASDRFTLGARAVRNGLVDPIYPINRASQRRVSPDWVEPTSRQYRILRLRAAGAAVHHVARTIQASPDCVRRDLSKLATANGARNDLSAGALYEALGWTRPDSTDPVPEPATWQHLSKTRRLHCPVLPGTGTRQYAPDHSDTT